MTGEYREKTPKPLPSAADVAASAKPFAELTADERVERLRLVVRGQDRQLAELRAICHTLMRHQHGADGRMVVPVVFGGGTDGGQDPDPAKAWL